MSLSCCFRAKEGVLGQKGCFKGKNAQQAATLPISGHRENRYVLAALKGSRRLHSLPVVVDPVLEEYTSGIVPQEQAIAVKDAYRAARITQAQAATMLGLSRPHLASRARQGPQGPLRHVVGAAPRSSARLVAGGP